MNSQTIVTSASRKKYAVTTSQSASLLTREQLRSIDRLVDAAATSGSQPAERVIAQSIPPLPFGRVEAGGDAVLQLTVVPVDHRESALDVPLRFRAPEEYHVPAMVDPPSTFPVARRVVMLLKGAESVPEVSGPLLAPVGEPSVAQVIALKDAETRAQSALRGGARSANGAHLLCLVGSLHYNYGNMEMALGPFRKALHVFEGLGDARGVAYCHNILGVCHSRLGEHKMALTHHKKQESLGGPYGRAVAQINMGVSYAALRELEFAEEAFDDALASARESSDKMLETIALGNLGLASLRVGNMRAAQTNLEQCLEQCSIAGDKSGAAFCLLLLGEVYSVINDYTHALFYYEHAFRVGGEANNADLVNLARVSIGVTKGNKMMRDAMLNQASVMGQQNDVQSVVQLLPT